MSSNVAEQIKTWLEVIQKLTLIAVVLSFVVFQSWWVNELAKFGVSAIKTPLGDISLQQVQAAAGQAQSVHRTLSDAADALQTLSGTLPPAAQQKVNEVAAALGDTAQQLHTSENALTETVVRAAQAGPQAPRSTGGWIYVGHVDRSRRAWIPQPSSLPDKQTPMFEKGEVVTIANDLYIHPEPVTTQRNQAPVVGVIRAGQKVRVSGWDYTPALRGGDFLWLNISSV
jgi:hypothetical protein